MISLHSAEIGFIPWKRARSRKQKKVQNEANRCFVFNKTYQKGVHNRHDSRDIRITPSAFVSLWFIIGYSNKRLEIPESRLQGVTNARKWLGTLTPLRAMSRKSLPVAILMWLTPAAPKGHVPLLHGPDRSFARTADAPLH